MCPILEAPGRGSENNYPATLWFPDKGANVASGVSRKFKPIHIKWKGAFEL